MNLAVNPPLRPTLAWLNDWRRNSSRIKRRVECTCAVQVSGVRMPREAFNDLT